MCPICWATALASFGGLFVVSILSLAATDAWMVAIAIVVGVATFAHRAEIAFVPWWLFAAMFGLAIGRVAHLVCFNRDRLLVVRAWGRACQIAAGRCPNRPS
jgi:hypothetical protein